MALDLTKSISVNAMAWSVVLDALVEAQDVEDIALDNLAARVTVLEASPATPSQGTFAVLPTITSDGTPQVGETLGFEFGTADKPFNTKRLFKLVNGAWQDHADASGGSGSVASEGSYQLWVSLVGGSSIGKSATIVVAAADVVTSVQAPVLSNPNGFVTGTNPPVFKVALNDNSLDKTLYRLVIEWDFNASGAFSYSSARSGTIEDLMAFANEEDATYAAGTDFAAGPVRFRTRLVPKSGSGPSSIYSNLWADTLKAKALPPASTVWVSANGDRKNRWFRVFETAIDTGDFRIANGDGTGANSGGMVTQSRTDARYWEQTVRARNTGPKGAPGVRLGACSDSAVIGTEGFTDPAGLIFYGYTNDLTQVAVGDVFLFYYRPATSGTNGLFRAWKNGSMVHDEAHAFQGAWRIYNSYKDNDETLLNTGQAAIANVNLITDSLDPSAQRYN